MNNQEQLVELVASLAILREQEMNVHKARIARETSLLQDPVYLGIVQAHQEAKERVETFTANIHVIALAEYEVSADKHPHPNVTIKIFTEAEITDMVVARDWCFDNLRPALKVDGKALAKYAKEFGAVPGVEVRETPKVQIASDLS